MDSDLDAEQLMSLGRRGQWWAMGDGIGGKVGVHGNLESVS
jgi:hypothetical protein